MAEDRAILDTHRHVPPAEIATLVRDLGPDVVAIDAPPTWAAPGRPRRPQRELRGVGVHCFNTPSDARMAEHPFYEWMTVGFTVFAAIAATFPRYRGSGAVTGTAIEVFPRPPWSSPAAFPRSGCLGTPGGARCWVPRVSKPRRSVRPTRWTRRSPRSPACWRSSEGSAHRVTRRRARSWCRRPRSPRTPTVAVEPHRASTINRRCRALPPADAAIHRARSSPRRSSRPVTTPSASPCCG